MVTRLSTIYSAIGFREAARKKPLICNNAFLHIKTNRGLTEINCADQSAVSEIELSITEEISKKI